MAFATLAAMMLAASAAASPAPVVTVASLLSQGYAVTAAITSPIGPGLFLQKGSSLYLCFVAETPNSADVSTRYCKPVH